MGVKGICIDPGTHVIKLHLGCITDVDAVDLHGCIEQDEGQEHIDGEDNKDGEKDISPRSLLILLFIIHLLPVMFTDSGPICLHVNRDQVHFPKSTQITPTGYCHIKGSSYLDPVGTSGTGYLIGKTLDF